MPNLRLLRGTADALPFAARSFDLVISINTIRNFDSRVANKPCRRPSA